jgi:hypothetical protein
LSFFPLTTGGFVSRLAASDAAGSGSEELNWYGGDAGDCFEPQVKCRERAGQTTMETKWNPTPNVRADDRRRFCQTVGLMHGPKALHGSTMCDWVAVRGRENRVERELRKVFFRL